MLFNPLQKNYNPNFKAETASKSAVLSTPIEVVSDIIEKPLDTFTTKPMDERSRQKRRKTITVASSIIVLSGLVALLNPRYSNKLLEKVKNAHQEALNKLKENKDNKALKFTTKVYEKLMQSLEFTNNFNSAKDVGFKWLCTEEKKFLGVKNKILRNLLQKIDSSFRFVMIKPYNSITKFFDNIGKKTVRKNYKKLNYKLDQLEKLILQTKNKLNLEEQVKVDKILLEIKAQRKYFEASSLETRLLKQEDLMKNLERDFLIKYRKYKKGFTSIGTDKAEHFNKNFSFWAQDIMMPARNKLNAQGNEAIAKLFNEGTKKGSYTELLEIISPHLDDSSKNLFKDAEKTMKNVNHIESIKYFDKKRDLVLGGAPTDILTAIGGLGLSGVAISTADDKDERISRLLTSGFPVIAGLGTSLALTGMLFSGIKSLIIGGFTGLGFNYIGDKTNDARIALKQKKLAKTQTNINKKMEVNNV